MKPRDLAELMLLAAIWGASFLFMRLSAADFGAVPLAAVRVAGAALLLLPFLARHNQWREVLKHAKPIAVVGVIGSALPFLMYAVGALAINVGVSSIVNATTPIWGAIVAWLWLGDRPNAQRVLGLLVGIAGVAWLAWDQASFKAGAHGVSPAVAIAACLVATLCYGFTAAFTKKALAGVPTMAVAAGSQLTAALVLAGPALWLWPAKAPAASSWWAAGALAVLCTGIAYVLYFRLIARVGAANATTVTFLIPIFAVLWGALFLSEALTWPMAMACGLVLLGTGLATGAHKKSRPKAAFLKP